MRLRYCYKGAHDSWAARAYVPELFYGILASEVWLTGMQDAQEVLNFLGERFLRVVFLLQFLHQIIEILRL